ncbi:siderophore-interacting protein [Rhodococcus gannanensis]|uniref:Siderophore-interacting protein n=1 Tax=Rhodococcus gannanensis TaxID=1960308 RepID=A0ABW4P461_9NOCA
MQRPDEPHHRADVVDVIDLSPALRRVRFGGPGLTGFTTSGDVDERILIGFGDAAGDAEHRRSYTVRAWHPVDGTVDVDFAVHTGGVAAAWARSASPGDSVRLSSPKGWWNPPAGADRLLLLADLTGLPAVGRIVESLPAGVSARVIVEVPGRDDRQVWATAAEVGVTWLIGTGNGTGSSALRDALPSTTDLDRIDYAWAGCESTTARVIRTALRRERGWAANRHHMMGYWQADKVRWLARYAEVQDRIEMLTVRELASGKSLDQVRDAIDDVLFDADL